VTATPQTTTQPKSGAPVIELRGIRAGFGNTEVLDGIDLAVSEGEFITVLGPSGCGKTTLLRIIAGLQPATAGSVRIEGGSPLQARRAKRFGWVPQSPALFPWRTVEENVRLLTQVGKSAPQSTSNAMLLDQVGLTDFAKALPHQLSGGMKQRVSLARAFALGAPILLMDEPFAALDEITRTEMRHLLLDLWQSTGAAVVFVTHSLAEAAYLSDRVVVMSPRPGRVVATHQIDFARPRSADIEDSREFFAAETAMRESLRQAMSVDR
jgi:NitT/TauT family transport system ATP-binding protein